MTALIATIITKCQTSVDSFVTCDLLEICSQRICLLWQLCSQGLFRDQINVVFNALRVSHILYALPVWSAYLSTAQIGRIDCFLKCTYISFVFVRSCYISLISVYQCSV